MNGTHPLQRSGVPRQTRGATPVRPRTGVVATLSEHFGALGKPRPRSRRETPANRWSLVVLAASVPAGWPLPSYAGDVGGSVSATTNYVYRGVSQTRGDAALQVDLHYQTQHRAVVGVWASTVDFSGGRDASVELDLYAGREWNLTRDWDARLGYTHYFYPGDNAVLRYDYDEVAGTLTYRSRIGATVAWSPNITRYINGRVARNEPAVSYELVATQPLFNRVAAVAGVGYYDLPTGLRADYGFWNAGVTWALGRAEVILMYIDTDASAVRSFGYERAANSWTGTLSWRF